MVYIMGPEQAADFSLFSASLRAVFALIAVLAAIALTSYLLRKFAHGSMRFAGKEKQAIHLDILYAKNIDNRRRLILVKRDEVAHLLLIGGTSDIVVESSIPLPADFPEKTTNKTAQETQEVQNES